MPSEIVTNKGRTEYRSKRGFQPLCNVLEENTLPITVKMEKSELLGRDNGLCTLQHRRVVTQLEYLQSSGSASYIPVSKEESALVVKINNEDIYETVEDLHLKKKGKKIQWFISTKEFYIDNVLCHVGHVFTFAPTSLLRSFRRGKKRGIYVLFYPTMEKHFVPMETKGSFYKCECPSTCRTYKLSELVKTKSFPCLLTFETNNGRIRDGLNTADPYFATGIIEHNVLYATKKSCGSLQLHTFSSRTHTQVNVQPNRKPVDVLDKNELEFIVESIVLPLNSDLRYFYVIHSYKELGIIRLLQEIIDELTERENNISVLSSACNRITENARKPFSFAKGKFSLNSVRKVPSKVKGCSSYVNQPYGNHWQRTTQARLNYGDDNMNKNTFGCNDDIVDIDDSGYVIVPISSNSPHSPTNGVQLLTYKSSENEDYNYQSGTPDQFDDHIYTYINPVMSDSPINSTTVAKCDSISRVDDRHGSIYENRTYDNISSINDEHGGDNVNDDTHYQNIFSMDDDEILYDYPHFGESNSLKTHIKELCCEEVIDLLKIMKMQNHIESFRKLSINGSKLSSYCEKDLINLNLTKFERVKMMCFIEGWRALKAPICDNAWMTQVIGNWSVKDVSKYLTHMRMRSLETFFSTHDVDGFLLKKLIDADAMESLKEQHDVMFRESSLEKLRNYVKREESHQFKSLSC